MASIRAGLPRPTTTAKNPPKAIKAPARKPAEPECRQTAGASPAADLTSAAKEVAAHAKSTVASAPNPVATPAPISRPDDSRLPFMIAVAVSGLMCYYRARPEERVARMVVHAMDDLIEHCLMPDGRFYYKELPSLQRRGAGTHVLQGLAHAYMLTGDAKYLRAGMDSFELSLNPSSPGWSGGKYADEDAVIDPQGPGPKSFAACLEPIGSFYRCAVEAGLLSEER